MTTATSTLRPADRGRDLGDAASGPEQLTLLDAPSTPARFRLSRDTRERGLRHVAEIRALLEERRRANEASTATVPTLHRRHDRAA